MSLYFKHALKGGLICQQKKHLGVKAYPSSRYVGDKGDQKPTYNYYMYLEGNQVTFT